MTLRKRSVVRRLEIFGNKGQSGEVCQEKWTLGGKKKNMKLTGSSRLGQIFLSFSTNVLYPTPACKEESNGHGQFSLAGDRGNTVRSCERKALFPGYFLSRISQFVVCWDKFDLDNVFVWYYEAVTGIRVWKDPLESYINTNLKINIRFCILKGKWLKTQEWGMMWSKSWVRDGVEERCFPTLTL